MAYGVIMLYHLHMPSYILRTFTEYPEKKVLNGVSPTFRTKVSLSIIFQKEAIIFICLNSPKRWFKRFLYLYFEKSYKSPIFNPQSIP